MKNSNGPNLLFLLCDQVKRSVLRMYGGSVPTPHLEHLADQGIKFEHCYCASPLCVPTRASMMTGRWPHAHGSVCEGEGFKNMKPGEELLIDRLHDAGYHTGYEGPWHINRAPGEDRSGKYAMFREGQFPYTEHDDMLVQQGGTHGEQIRQVRTTADDGTSREWTFSVPVPAKWTRCIDDHPDMVRAHSISEFIRSAPQDKPFAAWCSLACPHPPLLVPDPYYDLFKPEQAEPPVSFGEDMSASPRAVADSAGAQATRGWTWSQWARATATYCGYVAFIDNCFGVVLDALRASGRAGNTLVIATCDHGEMLGAHNLYQKSVMYDEAVHIPLIVSGLGFAPGTRSHLVSQVDLAPTILDVFGLAPLPCAQGKSLLPILLDPEHEGREYVFSEFNGEIDGGDKIRAVIGRRYKYVYHHHDRHQLFDMHTDPNELNNLVDRPESAQDVANLRSVLADWMQETNDFLRMDC